MPRRCSICDHADRAEIDRALVRGTPKRRIAAHHRLSETAVRRHADRHVPKLLARAAAEAEREETLTAGALLDDLRGLQRTARRLGDKAEAAGDLSTALRAVAELRGLLAVGLKGVESVELEERLTALERTLNRRTA